jgi:hypothetical protein
MHPRLIERCFTRAVTTTYYDIVIRRLETQSTIMESQKFTQRNRFIVLSINLLRYLALVVELLRARSRKAQPSDALLFYDPNPESIEKRRRHLEWNSQNASFIGVSYRDRVCTIPNARSLLRLMWWLLVTIVGSVLFRPSLLTPNVVRIVRTCLLTLSRVNASKDRRIYLFRIYRIETPFVAAFLKERGIRVHLVASSSPLSAHNRVLIGDRLQVCHPYQIDEFEFYRRLGTCESCELWSPETFYKLEDRYKELVIDEHYDTIGVYSQGFSLRDQLGTLDKNFAIGAVRREAELLEMVRIFASGHPDVHLVIFPHPMERRHYQKRGDHQFGQLVGLPNIDIDFSSAADSTLQFDQVGLGLTLLSSIGFERIFLGCRTIFYAADLEYVNWDISSPFHRIFYREQSAFVSAIDETRAMTHREFMIRFFGRFFYPSPWLARS